MRVFLLPLICLVILCSTPRALNAEYTLTVWSYQENSGPKNSHVWVVVTGNWGQGLHTVCISWMPVGSPRFFCAGQQGINWTHEETLKYAQLHGYYIWKGGPYQTTDRVYQKAVQQLTLLQSGFYQYAPLDCWTRPRAINCITAASLDCGVNKGTTYGKDAGIVLLNYLLR